MRRTLLFSLLLPVASTAWSCGQEGASPKADGRAEDVRDGGEAGKGGIDAHALGPSFCSKLDPAPFFCVDFEDGAPPDQRFTTAVGATVVDGALHVADEGAGAFVAQEADPSPHWSVVELGFSLTLDTITEGARMIIARIGQHQTDAECRLDLDLDGGSLTLRGSGTETAALSWKPRAGEPARIVLRLEEQGDAGRLHGSISVAGAPAIPAPIDAGCARLPGPPRVTLGRIDGSGETKLRFDDVVMDGI